LSSAMNASARAGYRAASLASLGWRRDGIVSKQQRPDSNESIRVPFLAEVSNGGILLRRRLRIPRVNAQEHNFFGRTVAALVSRFRNLTGHQFAPPPSTRDGRFPAGAIQGKFLRQVRNRGNNVRPVAIGAGSNQVSGEALRTFQAMANSRCHGASIQKFQRIASMRWVRF
jgi:hypothetical protein